MFDGVICKYFGGGLSVYILESNNKLVSIYMHKSNFQKSCGGHCPPMPKHSSTPREVMIFLVFKGENQCDNGESFAKIYRFSHIMNGNLFIHIYYKIDITLIIKISILRI